MRAAFLGRAAQRARETQTKGPRGKPPDARRHGLTEGSLKIGVSVSTLRLLTITQVVLVSMLKLVLWAWAGRILTPWMEDISPSVPMTTPIIPR